MRGDRLPDVATVLRDHFRSDPGVIKIVEDRSSLRLSTTLPAIRYAVITRAQRGPQEWDCQVQVECWAEVDHDLVADEVADAVLQSLPALCAEHRPADSDQVIDVANARVVNVTPSPDPTTGRARLLVLLELLVYAYTP